MNPKEVTTERVLEIPDLSVVLPLLDQAVQIPDSSYQSHLKIPDDLIDQLQNSERLLVDCSQSGLGDNLIELRWARALAFGVPDQEVQVRSLSSVLELGPDLLLPSNIHLTGKFDRHLIADPKSFLISFNPFMDILERWESWDEKLSPHAIKNRYFSARSNQLFWMERALAEQYDYPTVESWSYGDIYYSFILSQFGVSVTNSMMQTSLLKPLYSNINPTYDLVIAPDAREQTPENSNRSFKSLSPSTWAQVVADLPRDLSLGIVMGTAHPDYCQAVYDQALQTGHKISQIQTPTLAALNQVLLSTRRFVGMDSGTTHLASEAYFAKLPRGFDIRTLFNQMMVNLNLHGIRGLGEAGKMLVYKSPYIDALDIDNLPAQRVADFITK